MFNRPISTKKWCKLKFIVINVVKFSDMWQPSKMLFVTMQCCLNGCFENKVKVLVVSVESRVYQVPKCIIFEEEIRIIVMKVSRKTSSDFEIEISLYHSGK